MPTAEELEERITNLIDSLSAEQQQFIKDACERLDKGQIYVALMKATGITKGGDRN